MSKPKKTKDDLDVPPFLRRGSKEHAALVKKAEAMAKEGRGMMMVVAEDRDAPIHALAAELGFKKHNYRVEWFRDEAWLAARMEEKAKRDADEAAKKAKRDAEKAKLKAERELLGGGNRVRKERAGGSARKRADLPQGRIVWVGPNPKKEGTEAHARWEKLKSYDKKSVESYLFDKCNPTTLANALKAGKVKVLSDGEIEASGPAPEPAAPRKAVKGNADHERKSDKTDDGAGRRDRKSAGAGKKPAGKQKVGRAAKTGRVSGRAVKKGGKK